MSKIAITDYFDHPSETEKEILGDLVGMEMGEDTEVLMVWHDQVDEDYIKSMPNLRGVQRYGVGFDNLDIEFLKSKGIRCANNPDYGVHEVSDTALTFIMMASRGVLKYNSVAQGLTDTWQENIQPSIKRSDATTVGVIGAGRIGSSVLQKCKAIGFDTAFYDPYKPSGWEKVLSAKRFDSLDELLANSDIVSIHCPLGSETEGMINEAFVNSMKMGSTLVNTARGKLLSHTDVLYDSLKSNHLAGAFLDVIPQEPPMDDKLISAWRNNEDWLAGRLVINPHTSYYSQSAIKDMITSAAKNALMMFQGREIRNEL